MQRKDAQISYFLEAIKYEKNLERVKSKKKKQIIKLKTQGKQEEEHGEE